MSLPQPSQVRVSVSIVQSPGFGLSLGMGFVLAQNRICLEEPDAVLDLITAFDHQPAGAKPIGCAQGANYWH